jgi:cation:H+ antiporter
MVAFTLVLFAMTYEYEGRGQITRVEGFALISAYLAYQGYVVAQSI